MMSRSRARIMASLIIVPPLVLGLPRGGRAQSAPADGMFLYSTRLHDTLIGISQRLLLDPRHWRDLQVDNHIADPRRISVGTLIRIPYGLLRLKPATANIAELAGTVRVNSRDAVVGQKLSESDRIDTGEDGSVTLELPDGSSLTLQKSSTLSMDELRTVDGMPAAHDTRLGLQTGRLRTSVHPHGNVGRFEIRTPVAVSAVRGTQFRVAFDQAGGKAEDETLDGTVAVTGRRDTVLVPAGFGTRVSGDAAPLPPVRLKPPPDLDGLAGTYEGDVLHLQWPAEAGAIGYRVQMAADPGFVTLLSDVTSPAPHLDEPAPPDGRYWLRVRAIDSLDIEGTDAVKPIVEHHLPMAPTPVSPRAAAQVVGGQAAFSWSPVASATGYQLQVARDGDFARPLLEQQVGGAARWTAGVAPGLYYWRVRAINSHAEPGAWSAAQTYTQRPAAPTPAAPVIARRTLTLHWDAQDGMRYRLQVARDGNFDRPLLDQTLDVPTDTLRRPYPGAYAARIQTIAADGTIMPFGSARQFEVPAPRWLPFILPLAALIPLL